MNDKIELLTRNIERLQTILSIRESMAKCDEDGECDVCVGLQYAINIIERRLEA
jgi:hypothetical protein